MERITYQRTLDVHKNGIQFTLQGVETGDNLSRVVEISLMASGDAIDFPLENILPVMYVTTPKATEPSIIECTIKDNTVVYEVLPIVEEGITEMQLKLIETSPEGAKSVLVAPRFAVEVTKSNTNDGIAIQKPEFTALENAVAKAKSVYDKRFLRMELTSDCIFKAYYADGTRYETDILKKLFHTGDAVLAQSFARGGTGVRANEDTDNAMYYSNVSKSASLEAKDAIENSEEILEEVRLHGVYTAFKVDFESGEVEYVSPTYQFKINAESGELETDGGAYSFEDEIGRIVVKWLEENNVDIKNLQVIGQTHTKEIKELQTESLVHKEKIDELDEKTEEHETEILEIKESNEWKVLGATTFSLSDANNVENEIIIPIDESLLDDYSEVRYVITKGSEYHLTITGKANTNYCDVYLSSGDSMYLINMCNAPTSVAGVYNATFEEDSILYCGVIEKCHVIKNNEVANQYGVNGNANMNSLTSLVRIGAEGFSYDISYGKVSCSLIIELQVR